MFYRHHWRPEIRFAPGFGGRSGFGPFGFGFGGNRGGGFRSGRLLRDGDLRLVALALLEEAPRHGYDIIKALEERSGGFYSPSPGVVYPTLTYLEDVGYTTSAADGNKKVYTIADPGRAHLEENREQVATILEEIERFGQRMESAKEWWGWTEQGSQSANVKSEKQSTAAAELDRARRRLRALIQAATEGTDADQLRAAEALNRAADEILGQTPKS
jgi:DNA-binding PadR family transcriptional regulator